MIDKRGIFTLGGLDVVNDAIDVYFQNKKIKILDVGCGSGYSVDYLSRRGFDVIGIDNSEDIIDEGKKQYKDINIKFMDINNISFSKESFDLILFECSLSNTTNPIKILSTCKNLLKENGLILLSDFYLKKTDISDDTYTLNYWNRIFSKLDLQVISVQDKSNEWKNHLGMIFCEYGEMSGLLRGKQNLIMNNEMLNKETGYFLVTLRKNTRSIGY